MTDLVNLGADVNKGCTILEKCLRKALLKSFWGASIQWANERFLIFCVAIECLQAFEVHMDYGWVMSTIFIRRRLQ